MKRPRPKHTRELGVSEFKAKALGLFEETAKTGAEFTVLKKGKPIAKVIPFTASIREGTRAGSWRDLIEINDEDLAQVNFSDDWSLAR